MNKYTLTVLNIRQETEDAVTLCFKQPSIKKIKYKAGQYLTLSFRINERKYSRLYSFSSSPTVDDLLEITVKRMSKGIVSNFINDTIKIGDSVEVLEPNGKFVFDDNEAIETIYLWGIGSGITPLISIIKELLHTKPLMNIHLVYGNKNIKSTLFLSILKQLVIIYPHTFSYTLFYSQSGEFESNHNFIDGRINQEIIEKLLIDENNEKTQHFICGNFELKSIIKNSLEKLNYSKKNIFTEDFELYRDPKDFEEIENRRVTISNFGIKNQIEVVKGKSILDVALDAGIEIPYSCQTGICNTCVGILKTGNLKILGLNNGRMDLSKDEYLLCCSYPLSDDVYIEIVH